MSIEQAKKILGSLPAKPQHTQEQLIKLFPDYGPSRFLSHRVRVAGLSFLVGFVAAGWAKVVQANTTAEIERGDQEYQIRTGLVGKIMDWRERSAAYEQRNEFAQKVADGETLPEIVLKVPISVHDMLAERDEDIIDQAIRSYQSVYDGIPQDVALRATAVLSNAWKPLYSAPRTRLQAELEAELKANLNSHLPADQKFVL